MEPRGEQTDSRPDSPQSDDSSSGESDLSSPSFNRDSDFDFATQAKDVIEAEPARDNILAMAPPGAGSFENESDTNSTVTTKTILPSPKDISPAESGEKRTIRAPPKPVKSFHITFIHRFYLSRPCNMHISYFIDIAIEHINDTTTKRWKCIGTYIKFWFGQFSCR